jgi:hypothetical protein
MQTNQATDINTVFGYSGSDLSSRNILCRSVIPSDSTEVVQLGVLNKKITIRDIHIPRITVTYNLDFERRKMRNLIANGHEVDTSRTDKGIE